MSEELKSPKQYLRAGPAKSSKEIGGAVRYDERLGRKIGVDLENQIIYGYVLAEEGPFKDLRGEFNREALVMMVGVIQRDYGEKGLRSRFTHPSLSSDGLGNYLGRGKDPYLDRTSEIHKVRGDLHISPSSRDTPGGDIGGYVMRLALEDPAALSSSVVIEPRQEVRLNRDGTVMKDNDGNPLPKLWFPEKLWASDIVDTGDAVNDLLSFNHLSLDDLNDGLQRRGWEMLDRMFEKLSKEEAEAKLSDYVQRYLSQRFSPLPESPKQPVLRNGEVLKQLRAHREEFTAMVMPLLQEIKDLKPLKAG